MHPFAMPGNRSGAFSLNAGDRFIYDIDGRTGVADEFLQDGECFVTWDDGSFDTINWNCMSPLPVKVEPSATLPSRAAPQQNYPVIEMAGDPFPIERTPFFWRLLGQKPYRRYAMLRMPQGEIIGVFIYQDTPR